MSRVVIVSTTYERARKAAKLHGLWFWQWKYAAGTRDLHGLGEQDTVFVDAEWVATRYMAYDYQMKREIEVCEHAGAQVVVVDP